MAERLVQASWRLLFWLAFFAGLWMLQLPDLFEQTGRVIAALLFFGGALFFIIKDVLAFSAPTARDITRRLERESSLRHRPLTEESDEPAFTENDESYHLWTLEQQRRQRDFNKVKLVRWRVFLHDKDPYALRFVAIVILFAGFFAAGHQWQDRLINGLFPVEWYSKKSTVPPVIVTITPPEYTGIAQKVLQGLGQNKEAQDIPAGSTIHVLINNALLPPYIVMGGKKEHPDSIPDGGYEYTATLENNGDENGKDLYRFDVKQLFMSHYGFPYRLIPDRPPIIGLQEASDQEKQEADKAAAKTEESSVQPAQSTQPNEAEEPPESAVIKFRQPKVLSDAQIQIPLEIYDDYGVKTLTMRMSLDPAVSDAPLGQPAEQTRSVMSPPAQNVDIAPVYDFTDHTWAGLPVRIELSVEDQNGQSGTMDAIEMRLPERHFKHPVARQIIALRKRLAWEPEFAAIEVQYALQRLLEFPQDFQNDPIAVLTLRAAASRLAYTAERQNAPEYHNIQSVITLLWDIALRVEDGNLSIAARNLRTAQMRIESALQSETPLPPEQIAGLMNELRHAMTDYIGEYSKELQKRFAEGEELLLTPEMLAELLDPAELAEFFRQMESEMKSGHSDNARGMLSKLQRMLDMLNPDMALPIPEDMRFMSESVSELQQLIDMQKSLLDQTKIQADIYERFAKRKDFGTLLPPDMELFLHWGLDNLPPPPSSSDKNNARSFVPGLNTAINRSEQEALRYVLGQLMLDSDAMLGKIPEKMGLAEREMLGSSDDLTDTRPDQSIPHQELAIEYLSQAQQEMQEELEQRLQQMAGGNQSMMQGDKPFGGFSKRFGQGGGRYDPLGRPVPGGGDGKGQNQSPDSDVKIPDEAERKRVEEILRTLRERSGELERPREELDYFRRLLRQF